MKRWTWITMLVVLGVSTAAWAGPGRKGGGDGDGPGWGHGGPGGHGLGLCKMLRDPELGVTDEQAARLKPLCLAQREQGHTLFQSMGDLHEAVRAELEKDAPDFDRVGALHQQMAALKTDLVKQHVALRTQVRGILTAEQLAKLKTMRDARPGRHGRGDGPQDGHGCGGDEGPSDRPRTPPTDAAW